MEIKKNYACRKFFFVSFYLLSPTTDHDPFMVELTVESQTHLYVYVERFFYSLKKKMSSIKSLLEF